MRKVSKRSVVLRVLALTLVLFFAAFYISGYKSTTDLNSSFNMTFNSIEDVENWVAKEATFPNLKPEASPEIIWADSSKKEKTAYSLVYIHGFSASKDEGNPVHRAVADSLGMNAFFCRLPAHGLNDVDAFKSLTANDMIATAEQAIQIGKLLGEKVIVMGTSTGGTLSLIEASKNPEIAAVILYSPLIDFTDNRLTILTYPHGIKLAEQILGSEYREEAPSENPVENAIWYYKYHVKGLESLAMLVYDSMNPSLFAKVKQPVFLGYYYKDEENQDKTVSVAAMLTMFDQLGTPDDLKIKKAYPNSGSHVIVSDLRSKSIPEVIHDTISFIQGLSKP
jgi:esterase/lipase